MSSLRRSSSVFLGDHGLLHQFLKPLGVTCSTRHIMSRRNSPRCAAMNANLRDFLWQRSAQGSKPLWSLFWARRRLLFLEFHVPAAESRSLSEVVGFPAPVGSGSKGLTWKCGCPSFLSLESPAVEHGGTDSEVSCGPARADILTCGQFKSMVFEFGGVGLSGGHGLASYGEA